MHRQSQAKPAPLSCLPVLAPSLPPTAGIGMPEGKTEGAPWAGNVFSARRAQRWNPKQMRESTIRKAPTGKSAYREDQGIVPPKTSTKTRIGKRSPATYRQPHIPPFVDSE